MKKVKKITEYSFQLHAHNRRGFDTWIILNNLPCDKKVVEFIENGREYFLWKCSVDICKIIETKFLINYFSVCYDSFEFFAKKLKKKYNLRKEFIETEGNLYEIYGDN